LLLIESPDSPAERTAEKRRIRKHQILNEIRRSGPIARVEIARNLGFNLPTVSGLVDELVSDGLAIESEARKTAIGRRPIPVSLNPNAASVLGVDVGKIVTIGLLMNLSGTVLGRVESATPPFSEPSNQGEWVREFVHEFLASHADTIPPLAGVGVALPGFIYRPERAARHLAPEVEAIQTRLKQDLDIPVIVDNDAQMMALGALWFGNATELRTFCILNVGYGLGMGMVIDRTVYQGFFGHAGEIGHVPLGEPGLRCYCGGRSCLENTASGSGIERMARDAGLVSENKPFMPGDIADMARAGNPAAKEIFSRFARALAHGVGSVVTLFNPEAVILAGRLTRCADVFYDEMMEEIRELTLPGLLSETSITISDLRENAGPLGTCACVLNHIFSASHIAVESIV
jgi:predicted NBD/HSP70 family sugar kinase